VDWRGAVQKGGLCAHLNFSGEAEIIWRTGTRIVMHPGTLWWVRGPLESLLACRRCRSREAHECLSLVFPDPWLEQNLHLSSDAVSEAFTPLVLPPFPTFASFSRSLQSSDRVWAHSLMAAHLCEEARRLLDGARLTEFLVREIFRPEGDRLRPQTRTERVTKERIEKVKAALLRSLDAPPPLDSLADIVGCTPSHLSRTFTQIEGITLSLWLRHTRMDRAAELIASGQCNVSEAAIEVGYQSFSHFSRAFLIEKGVQPSKWIDHLQAQETESISPSTP
jgi:AraC-like DNA-binding protein